MPIYEYSCQDCKTKFEKLAKSMNSSESVSCPKCASKKTARSLSVFAVGAAVGGKPAESAPGMCGRCGGPGPCGMN